MKKASKKAVKKAATKKAATTSAKKVSKKAAKKTSLKKVAKQITRTTKKMVDDVFLKLIGRRVLERAEAVSATLKKEKTGKKGS